MDDHTPVTENPEDTLEATEPEQTKPMSDADIKHNVKVNVLLDAIFFTGVADVALVAAPMYVYLKASDPLIGLMGTLSLVSLIGVFLSPFISRRFPYKKWYLFVSHIPYIGAWGFTGVIILLTGTLGLTHHQILMCVFLLNSMGAFFGGFVSLPHQEFLAACIPMSHRGRYTGYSFSIGGIGSVISSALGGLILLRVAKPMAFGYLYLMVWFICQSGYLMALLARERRTPVEKAPKPWTKGMTNALWQDKHFLRVVVINIAFALLIETGFYFIPIYGYRALHMIPAMAAIISIIQQVVRIALSSSIGQITDRLSPKRLVPFWFVVAALAFAAPVLMRNSYGACILPQNESVVKGHNPGV